MASGMMVAGQWITDQNEQNQNGEFHAIPTTFRDRFGNTNSL